MAYLQAEALPLVALLRIAGKPLWFNLGGHYMPFYLYKPHRDKSIILYHMNN